MTLKQQLLPRLERVGKFNRITFAAECAAKVLPLFLNSFPEHKETMNSAIATCLDVGKGVLIEETDLTLLVMQVDEAVPTLDDHPDCSAQFYAAESVMTAIRTVSTPTAEMATDAATCAYDALHMDMSKRMYPIPKGKVVAVSGADAKRQQAAIDQSEEIQEFLKFVEDRLQVAERSGNRKA